MALAHVAPDSARGGLLLQLWGWASKISGSGAPGPASLKRTIKPSPNHPLQQTEQAGQNRNPKPVTDVNGESTTLAAVYDAYINSSITNPPAEVIRSGHRIVDVGEAEQDDSAQSRFHSWTAGFRIALDYPVFGAGVRNLEREIGRISRKVARLKAEERKYPAVITPDLIEKFLDPPQYIAPEIEKADEVGVVQSLAWTENGGEIMAVEVAVLEGKGSLQMTGQLGEVMQESAQAALTYIKSRAAALGIEMEVFERMDIHLHMPEGAIPKDGPSAGITIATAMISALTGRPVYRYVGMTGEITLRGRVLPIGGVREKVLAGHRVGLKVVLLPEKNLKDLHDVPKTVRSELEIIPIAHMDQVIDLALSPEPTIEPPRPRKRGEEPPNEDSSDDSPPED